MSGRGLWGELQARAGGHDRGVVALAGVLMVAGFLLSLAASPAAANQNDAATPFHFAMRHAVFIALAVPAFIAASLMRAQEARRLAVFGLLATWLLLALVLLFAAETKGARRWLDLPGGFSFQPSEFLKPALVVVWAWLLAEKFRSRTFPGLKAALVLFLLSAGLLLAQPDVGQTTLLGFTLLAMMLFAGAPWPIFAATGAAGAVGLFGAYFAFDHVRLRIDAFLGEGGHQVGLALKAIAAGGVFGRGPGEGIVKQDLPDAHSDFIYAVAAEEYGLLASLGLVAAYAAVLWRGLWRTQRVIDPFAQIAAAGLFCLLALQAMVHIAVNIALAPAKGMTLPFVSYGGSSLIGAAVTLGWACAFSRREPGAWLEDAPQPPSLQERAA